MLHPNGNNFKAKECKEVSSSHIRKIDMVANKKGIARITFSDADDKVICDIKGTVDKGDHYSMKLGPNEYIVGCEQWNDASLRDIKFYILDKGEIED